jgi:hypothetical protein
VFCDLRHTRATPGHYHWGFSATEFAILHLPRTCGAPQIHDAIAFTGADRLSHEELAADLTNNFIPA